MNAYVPKTDIKCGESRKIHKPQNCFQIKMAIFSGATKNLDQVKERHPKTK